MITNKEILIICVSLWLFVAHFYILRTPFDHRTHDMWGHVFYTQYIVGNKKLPKPYDQPVPGGQTIQPPLYYLICSFIKPDIIHSKPEEHIRAVRYLSVLFGAVAILIIGIFLNAVSKDQYAKLTSLIFIETTPKFAFVFSTYNNDSLNTLLWIIVIAFSYFTYKNFSFRNAVILFLFITAALYTKGTSLLFIAPLTVTYLLITLKKALFKGNFKPKSKYFLLPFLCSIIAFSPWLYYRNFKNCQRFFPTTLERDIAKPVTTTNFKNLLGIVLRDEWLLDHKFDFSHEWDKPWALIQWDLIPHRETKRYDYFGFEFVTSVIGEFVLTSPSTQVIWILFILHLFVYVYCLLTVFKSQINIPAILLILTTMLVQLITLVPFAAELPQKGLYDFRYYAWLWICWALLQSNSLTVTPDKYKKIIYSVYITGVIFNIYTLLTIKGGYYWM